MDSFCSQTAAMLAKFATTAALTSKFPIGVTTKTERHITLICLLGTRDNGTSRAKNQRIASSKLAADSR